MPLARNADRSSSPVEPLETRRLFAASLAAGTLTIRGTPAADDIRVLLSGASYRVTVTPAGATGNDGTIETYTYDRADVQRFVLRGGAGGDLIRVQDNLSLAATLLGEGGNDTLVGNAGNNYLYGEDGDDVLYGQGGNDVLSTGGGKNYAFGGDGNDRLNGSSGRDYLYGEGGVDRLYGGNGDDRLDGGGNTDRLYGQGGNDALYGSSSNDRLFGDDGNDTLYGGSGNNYLDGGAGTDKGERRTGSTLVAIEAEL